MNRRWLITGASGQLGAHIVRRLSGDPAGDDVVLPLVGPRADAAPPARRLDLADAAALAACLHEFRPTHVLHAGGMTAVAECHARPIDAFRVNVDATRVLIEVAARQGARVLYCSTDMVFDGQRAPYREADPPAPLSVYGRTKRAAESLLRGLDRALVVRLPLLYGLPAAPRQTTFVQQIDALRRGEPLRLFIDEFRTPISLLDAAGALVELARSETPGVIHVAGPERLSRYQMGERFAAALGIRDPRLEAVSRQSIAAAEPRPADLSLDGARFLKLMPQLAPRAISRETMGL